MHRQLVKGVQKQTKHRANKDELAYYIGQLMLKLLASVVQAT